MVAMVAKTLAASNGKVKQNELGSINMNDPKGAHERQSGAIRL
jgi:hypothetical protein